MYDVQELFLFRGLSADERADVFSMLGKSICFKKGDIIYDEQRFERALGVFLSGRGFAGNGRAKKRSFSEGDVFGAAAVFGADDRYVSRVEAASACTVQLLPEGVLRQIFARYPICAVNYIAFLSDRVRYLNRKIAQYTESTAQAKLLRLLLDRADENGRVPGVNLSLFAELTGMGRTSVYRALAALEEDGSIRRDKRDIYVRG